MHEPNTLFLIAKSGLKGTDQVGVLESWMWMLDSADTSMEYVSFHKTKSARAYKGGKVIEYRDATNEEFQTHQELLKKRGEASMAESKEPRKIIVFEPVRSWNKLWPASAKSKPMAFKGLVHVPPAS